MMVMKICEIEYKSLKLFHKLFAEETHTLHERYTWKDFWNCIVLDFFELTFINKSFYLDFENFNWHFIKKSILFSSLACGFKFFIFKMLPVNIFFTHTRTHHGHVIVAKVSLINYRLACVCFSYSSIGICCLIQTS